MAPHALPTNIYTSQNWTSQRASHSTIIEDSPQDYWSQKDFTPRQATFDDLYDVSDCESVSEDVPIAISLSPIDTRSMMKQEPLQILSPTGWPIANGSQRPGEHQRFDNSLLSPHITVPRMKLSLLTNRHSMHSSNAPSLDGSLTSEEMATISCPSTPDMSTAGEDPSEWTMPAQLQPSSMMTLGCLSQNNSRDTLAISFHPVEMQERGGSLSQLTTQFEICMTPIEDGELSAISIPSPGGFFSSLNDDSRATWMSPHRVPPVLQTATAEIFYGVPFGSPAREFQVSEASQISPVPSIRPPNIEIYEDTDLTEGPPTARQIPAAWNCGTPDLRSLKSPNFTEELMDFNERNEQYARQLRESSKVNIDRTQSWLTSQGPASEKAIVDIPEYDPLPEEQTYEDDEIPAQVQMEEPVHTPLEESEYLCEPETTDLNEPVKDDVLFRGFQHLQTAKSDNDAFVHRKTRSEKLRLDRKCLFTSHVNQLQGKYTLGTPQPVTAIKTFNLGTVQEEDPEKELIATAVKEQYALQQLEPVAWNVEAIKYLNGGTLLTSPTAKIFSRKRSAKILDLGGHSTCDWSWQVAIEHPEATVQTVWTADCPIDTSIATPTNHKQKQVPNLWTLPFPNNHFDCISARNIYSLLRISKPKGRNSDEYDLCLRECMRVLRPGGYLEFALLDSDIINCGPKAAAINMHFESNLKAYCYDHVPTKTWLNRVRKHGFENIRRAWLVLPMSQHGSAREGPTAEASHITGMVGSWAWERWMLKLHKEMGKDDAHLLDGVAAAFEEGSKTGGSWRCLSGWARKPY